LPKDEEIERLKHLLDWAERNMGKVIMGLYAAALLIGAGLVALR
jgi:hypothetical protein